MKPDTGVNRDEKLTNNQPKLTQGEILQENRTLYVLRETGKLMKGEMELCNKFYFSVQPDYARGTTEEDANKFATDIKMKVNMHDELVAALKEIIESCNPQNVEPNKKYMGLNLGEYYVGGCGIPSNKAIHMAINALKKSAQK